ncbi:MAG TPA: 16S rRNA (guanine(966)-N(2))-methyltransferase RsmD [Methylomirabilota bacterium]|jgi:16S rRNA (guanine(966)-N(2))-methyltransferase RsmD|nr:16S rRNA (guanine(966)-N(2))-methyltransferase RsmD [Methylomirabilota bacterium]
MRVLAGALKGQRLTSAGGSATRPTSDRVRIACLDTLMPYLAGGAFLDLFAGAGSVGIEALSRGAPSAVFVERDGLALRALRDNLERLQLNERARVLRVDAARAVATLAARDERFAVVFVDPPYDSPRAAPALEAVAAGGVLAPGAVVALQHSTKSAPADAIGVLRAWKTRRFGETTLTFFRAHA